MNPINFSQRRAHMVEHHVAGRGVQSPRVQEVMRGMPREAFVPEAMHEFAFDDVALPADHGQLLPRPSTVGIMLDALNPGELDNVLEIGTATGYVTALLSRLSASVHSIESSGSAAQAASAHLRRMGCDNVLVRHDSGAQGWPEEAPFDAILVHACASHVPQILKTQLALGGRLVMGVGADPDVAELVRVTRLGHDEWRMEDMADLVADAIWGEAPHVHRHSGAIWTAPRAGGGASTSDAALAQAVTQSAEPFDEIDAADLEPLLQRIGDSRVVLLGEASHGSSEFYRMRARITRELIVRKGFSFVAIEGDWPAAARIDQHVHGGRERADLWAGFTRFPGWMWRNEEVRAFVDWLRAYNIQQAKKTAAFYGLDLYSLYASIDAVLAYLDRVDPPTARVARHRYGCLTPWQSDPASYGLAAMTERYRSCEREVVDMLIELQDKCPVYIGQDGEQLLDALQNARIVSQAERYYRTMYYGSRVAWNLRDTHMFSTLRHLLSFHGAQSKAVIWAHNSHVGDSAATEMSLRGEFNLGNLCRKAFGSSAYLVGFGTHTGTVAAATDWDAPMEVKAVRPALAGSYERLFHETGLERFMLPLRQPASRHVAQGLASPRLERAIGVIYRPEAERQSHYFDAVLPRQFDEYIWFDQTCAVTPLKAASAVAGVPETYPFEV